MPEDKFIAESEKAELDAYHSARAANLFDVRRFIGGLFVIYGVILLVLGLGASDADVEKAAGRQREPLDRAGDADRRRALPRLGVHAPARRPARGGGVRAGGRRGRGRLTRSRPAG